MTKSELNERGINILSQFEGMTGNEIIGTFSSIAYHICKTADIKPSDFSASFTVALAMITADNEPDEDDDEHSINTKLS